MILNRLKAFVANHPQITAWVVLAVGMVIILLWSAKDVGLLPGQMIALIAATVLVAGLCVWIIGWEDEEAEQAQQ
jgi:MFS superfamily sulfate permease-like transporter